MGLKRNFAKVQRRRKTCKEFLDSDKSPKSRGETFKAGFNVGWKECTKWLIKRQSTTIEGDKKWKI